MTVALRKGQWPAVLNRPLATSAVLTLPTGLNSENGLPGAGIRQNGPLSEDAHFYTRTSASKACRHPESQAGTEAHSLAATHAWRAFLVILIAGEGQDSGRWGIRAFCLRNSLSTPIATHGRSATRKRLYVRAGHDRRGGQALWGLAETLAKSDQSVATEGMTLTA